MSVYGVYICIYNTQSSSQHPLKRLFKDSFDQRSSQGDVLVQNGALMLLSHHNGLSKESCVVILYRFTKIV